MADYEDDWDAGKPLLLRMNKRDREMLEYVSKRSGMNLSRSLRAMIRTSYRRAEKTRKRLLGESF